jgi:hypothetical protein
MLVEAQAAVQAAATAASDASGRLSAALAERDALAAELRALQQRLEAVPAQGPRARSLLGQLKVRSKCDHTGSDQGLNHDRAWAARVARAWCGRRPLSAPHRSNLASHPYQEARRLLREERDGRAAVTDALLGHAGRLRRKYRHLEGRYDALGAAHQQVGSPFGGGTQDRGARTLRARRAPCAGWSVWPAVTGGVNNRRQNGVHSENNTSRLSTLD